MGVALQGFGIASAFRRGANGTARAVAGRTARQDAGCVVRWLTLACGAAMLAGCVTPSYPPYPTPLYLPPPYVAQPPYFAQPPYAAQPSSPVPLYPAPEPRRETAPAPEDAEAPVGVPEPMPEPEPPAAPTPEAAAPTPPTPAGPGADVLQGFRPMRGQTRPGI